MASNLPRSSVVSHEDIKLDAQGQSHDLSQAEQDILARQLSLPPLKASYFMLYRYATRMDLLIIVVSSICAIAAGAIFPIMTVSILLIRLLKTSSTLPGRIRQPYFKFPVIFQQSFRPSRLPT